jgi:hypothetical protein
MTDKQINILGQEYTIKFENTRTDKVLKNCDGECRWYLKEIIIDDELELTEHKNHVIKHEIIHAFLAESGLKEYREDELIVDWFAWNIGKIKKVIDEVLNAK